MKKSIIICIALLLLFSMNCISYAEGVGDIITIGSVTPKELEGVQAEKILGTMQWVGYLIAVGMIIFCGIKYVMSGAGEKAKLKTTLIPIIIGAILIASAVLITSSVFKLFAGE